MSNRRALGRGLNSLIPDSSNEQPIKKPIIGEKQPVKVEEVVEEKLPGDKVEKLSLNKIRPREGQPRTHFDEDALNELANSIREYGLLNPIVVTPKGEDYEILAGERRYRASKLIGNQEIDVIIRDYNTKDVEILSLVENVQREDLNALEEANAYKKLSNEYAMTQDQIAKTMGKSRSYIANTMRLLNLNEEEKLALTKGQISPSQARTLLSVQDRDERSKVLSDFITGEINIRKVEKANKKKTETINGPSIDDILMEDLEEKFMDSLGSKVAIKKSGKAFKVTIDCYDIEEVEKVYEKLTNETN